MKNINNIIKQISCLDDLDYTFLMEELYNNSKKRFHGGYIQLPYDTSLSKNVVFTISNQKIQCDDITYYYANEEWEDDRNEEYGKNGEAIINRRITDIMYNVYPKIMEILQEGDIVRYFNKNETYRNCGVYLVHNEQIVNLCLEDGFHDYGIVPRCLRKFYAIDWADYGFHCNYPEYNTKYGILNMKKKKEMLDYLT